MAEQDLCTLEQVREFLQARNSSTEDDPVTESLITRASEVIMRYCRREFAPVTASEARTFVYYGGGYLSLAPYDLRTVTSVVIDTDLAVAEQTTLVAADGDYRLRPKPSRTGTYTWLELPNHGVTYARDEREVTVTGAWGFAEVPVEVEHACIVTVAEWLRGGVHAFSRSFSIDEGRVERPQALPSAVMDTLSAYRIQTIG